MVEIFPATFMEKQRQNAEVDNQASKTQLCRMLSQKRGVYPEDATQRATTLI
jgi:hypothetical protein